jgi:hypothetical protein
MLAANAEVRVLTWGAGRNAGGLTRSAVLAANTAYVHRDVVRHFRELLIMKYCTKMGLCMWRSLYNGRASCVSTEPCELAVAPENDAQQLQAKVAALADGLEVAFNEHDIESFACLCIKLRQPLVV